MVHSHTARKTSGRQAPSTEILRVRVELEGIDPTIWRTLEIEADCTFFDLHVALNDAMGWTDAHLHQFLVGLRQRPRRKTVCYRISLDEEYESPFDERVEYEHRVAESVAVGTAFHYEYDFGDSWMHRVVVEARSPRQAGVRYPRVLAGAGACPPEDCGGIHGYARLLHILGDPQHEEHAETLEWLGERFDPAAFDPETVQFRDPHEELRDLLGGA